MATKLTTDLASDELETKDFGTSDAYADNVGWTTLLGGPYGISHTGVSVNPVKSLQFSAVYACVRVLTGDIAKLNLRLLRDKNGIWLPERAHPLARLLRRPNSRMTQHDFTQHIVMSILLVGNAYVAIIRDNNGRPVQLIPLIPSTVSIREDGDGRLFYFVTNRLLPSELKVRTISEDDMLHVRALSLDGGIRGASVTQLASETFGLALATQELAASMFRNGATMLGLLSTEEALNKEAIEQVAQQWANRDGGFAGVHNGYKTPVLQRGLKYQPISQNAQESQLLETRRQLVEECARIFGVPLYKLSSVDKLGYNSIDAQAQDYIDSTLIPLTNPIEQALEQKLLFDREFDDFRFSFDFSDLEKGDLKTRTETQHMLLTDGVLNVNEVRNRMNLPGIGPEGDIYTKPTNTGVLGQVSGLPIYQINAPVKETEEMPAQEQPATTNDKAIKPKKARKQPAADDADAVSE